MPNSLDYGYANPIPGSVATGSSAVSQATEAGHFDNNPAFSTASELQRAPGGRQDGFTQPYGNQNPGAPEPAGAADRDNPATIENLGDSETQLRGEGLGDALAGVRPAIGAPRADGLTVTQTPST